MHCPVCGVNIPRFLACIVAGFLFILSFDYLIHHNLLMDFYQQTQFLWRPAETMGTYFPLMLVYQFLLVTILAFIFTRNFEGKGVAEGARFGVMMGALLALLMASGFIWMPISPMLAAGWAAAGFGNGLGLGLIFSLIYKK